MTLLLPQFATQIFTPSKATLRGSLIPAGNVLRIAPSSPTFVTVLRLKFAAQIFVP